MEHCIVCEKEITSKNPKMVNCQEISIMFLNCGAVMHGYECKCMHPIGSTCYKKFKKKQKELDIKGNHKQ